MTARTGHLTTEADAPFVDSFVPGVAPSDLSTSLRPRPLTATEVAAARRVVAACSRDAADCAVLLDALGIGRDVTVAVAG